MKIVVHGPVLEFAPSNLKFPTKVVLRNLFMKNLTSLSTPRYPGLKAVPKKQLAAVSVQPF